MTSSAPIDRTISKFRVLHTPVTCAPNDLAICTANVPTPPAAPLTRTLLPAKIFPWSRRPCNAVSPATNTDAACSNVTLSGLITKFDLVVHAYSAKAPRHEPNTSSPGLNCVTLLPTASTSPATSADRHFEQPRHYAERARLAIHEAPINRIDGGRADSDQNFIVLGSRLLNLLTLEHVRRAIFVINDCL